ncbi:hypothetical protein MANES_10G109546v8 [Manihot esculenta]|uniref:Uncharacterized protein n=1 Tax=Manihot esculenta TaxID=3983 RepID=A0ACB7H180_MANES|nr:hypothetical protein MANES_10G109546v8 [Manihot esculenta]
MEPKPVKLFVKVMNSEDPTIEIHADSNDSIKSIHEKILVAARIPVTEQKLFHNGKQLDQCLHTLEDCSIENEASLELKVELRWDDSDESSALLQKIHKMSSNCCRMCQVESVSEDQDVSEHDYKTILEAFMLPKEKDLEILNLYSVPATMVMLYNSPIEGNYEIHLNNGLRTMLEILDFFKESLVALLHGLGQAFYPSAHIQSLKIQFRDFRTFSRALCQAIHGQAETDEDGEVDNEDDETDEDDEVNNEDDERKVDNEDDKRTKMIVRVSTRAIKIGFIEVLKKMEVHLSRLPLIVQGLKYTDALVFNDAMRSISFLYLAILKELNSMSQLVKGGKDKFRQVLEGHKNSLPLMIKNVTRKDDYDWLLEYNADITRKDYHGWLLEHNDVLDSASRMHLLMMKMIPEKKLHDPLLYKPLIRWSKYMDEKLYEQFRKKNLTDSQVLQDCLCKLCQILFKPQNLLLLACPNDPTKFYPNPELKRQPLHLDSFKISGIVIALALMHEVHIGIAFHHLFLLLLAGNDISMEDIREACPSFCNKKAKEPSHDDNLIRKEFIQSVSEQINFFKQGFHSVFGESINQLLSYRGIELEDLNQVLQGNLNLKFNFGKKRKYEDNESDPLTSQNNESDPLMYQFFKVNRQRVSITEWQEGKFLGKGGFGEVYEGYAPGGFFFAIKEIKIENEGMIEEINHEIDLLYQLRHPNIVSYYGTERRGSKVYIFLELVRPGSLKQIYKKGFKLEDSQVSHYTKQILEGLNYLHGLGVAHRDIKCENILVNYKGRVKITDFGLAKVPELNAFMKSCCGTIPWMAPEVIKRDTEYGFKADIWSLGCTVLEMLTGESPYSDLNCGSKTLKDKIVGGKLPTVPDSLSELSRDFIMKCLQVNPDHRPTAAELLQDPFVKGSAF